MNVDILIVTIDAQLELPAILDVFGIRYSDNKLFFTNRRYWSRTIRNSHSIDLKIVITDLVEQGNPEAGSLTTKFLQFFKPAYAFLVGTSAGIENKVKLGDVLFCNRVIYYESQRKEGKKIINRLKDRQVKKSVHYDISHFIGQQGDLNWNDNLIKYLSKSESFNSSKYSPKLRIGNIASGEKLLADGSLKDIREQLDDKIRVAEMEGYGFANACENEDVVWSIIRGVSDYGDPKSKDNSETKDQFHLPSTAAAASACKTFITHGLTILSKNSTKKSQKLSEIIEPIPVKAVLISVGDKTNLESLVDFFKQKDVHMLCTPTSYSIIKKFDDRAISILDYVNCDSLLRTRGTLHPYLLASIKANRNNDEELKELASKGLIKIDLVVVNSYKEYLKNYNSAEELLRYFSDIQVGGPSLLRWVIRHFKGCAAITNPKDYENLIDHLEENNMKILPEYRIMYLRKSLNYIVERDRETLELFDELRSRSI